MSILRYCTLTVGDALLGIEVDDIREVLLDAEVTPVPFAPPAVLGLLSRRGEIVTVLDGLTHLGLERAAGSAPSVHVLVREEGETVCLAVDGEGDVVALDSNRLQAAPGTVTPALRRRLRGMAELDDGRLMLALRCDSTAEPLDPC